MKSSIFHDFILLKPNFHLEQYHNGTINHDLVFTVPNQSYSFSVKSSRS